MMEATHLETYLVPKRSARRSEEAGNPRNDSDCPCYMQPTCRFGRC